MHHAITTFSYFFEKTEKDREQVRKAIAQLVNRFSIIEVNEYLIRRAMDSDIDDFEDTVVEVSAMAKMPSIS